MRGAAEVTRLLLWLFVVSGNVQLMVSSQGSGSWEKQLGMIGWDWPLESLLLEGILGRQLEFSTWLHPLLNQASSTRGRTWPLLISAVLGLTQKSLHAVSLSCLPGRHPVICKVPLLDYPSPSHQVCAADLLQNTSCAHLYNPTTFSTQYLSPGLWWQPSLPLFYLFHLLGVFLLPLISCAILCPSWNRPNKMQKMDILSSRLVLLPSPPPHEMGLCVHPVPRERRRLRFNWCFSAVAAVLSHVTQECGARKQMCNKCFLSL